MPEVWRVQGLREQGGSGEVPGKLCREGCGVMGEEKNNRADDLKPPGGGDYVAMGWNARWWWPILAGVLAGVFFRLLYSNEPARFYNAMMSSFVLLVPVVVGAVTVYLAELTARRDWWYCFGVAAGANALFVVATLLIFIEGFVCAILAAPLFSILGGIGGVAMGAVCRWTNWPRRAVYSVAALPLVLGAFEQRVPLPNAVQVVESVRVVAARPEWVWDSLLMARQIAPEEMGSAWMYRIGAPLPLSAVTEMRDGEWVRHIAMGRNVRFDQVAAEWEPGRRVRWTYRFDENSFPAGALDDHVRIGGDYFDVVDTEYALDPVAGGTRLSVRMRYRVSTHFNWYARPIAQFLVRNFEETALAFYARRAEAGAVAEAAGMAGTSRAVL